jgi:leucyl-tRNA synthetase
VTDDLGPKMRLNTAVAAIMELNNAVVAAVDGPGPGAALGWALREAFEAMARLLAPFAPHVAEELWESLGHAGLVAVAAWPAADPGLLEDVAATVVVQVNGKLRGSLTLARGVSQEQALAAARGDARIAAHLAGKELRRVVYVADKLLNLVVG